MPPVVTAARFPAVSPGAGHYESFYLKACRPDAPVGVWIRYTVLKPPGAAPRGSLWCTVFEGDGPRAVQATTEVVGTTEDCYIYVGEGRFEPGRVYGAATSGAARAAWDLRFQGPEQPLHHLPRRWMYRAPLPRTKLLSPYPDVTFDGTVEIGGRRHQIDGWRGMVGHNWGAEHAERWIWLHGSGFDGRPDAWLDVAIGRLRLGPATTPWIANGALSIGGVRHRLGGLGPGRRGHVRERPERCEFLLRGSGIRVRGTVGAPRHRFVGWIYSDPDGSQHHTVNCSIADMELTVEGSITERLVVRHAAAYELGMRETDHGIPVQPAGDG